MSEISLEYILVTLSVLVGAGIVYALNNQQGIADVSDLKELRQRVDEQDKQIDFLLGQVAEMRTWTITLRMERDIARQEAVELRKDLERLKKQMGLLS